MERAYHIERKRIIDDLVAKKAWIIGDATALIRHQDPTFDAEQFWLDWLQKEMEWLREKYTPYLSIPTENQESDDKKFSHKHMWIGINPCKIDEGKMFDLYYKLYNADLGKWEWEACVEQNTQEGRRPHIHMILYNDIRPNRVIKKLLEIFECAPNFVECKTSYDLDLHQKYIRGYKKDEKMPFVHLDREDRREKIIPDVFLSKKGHKERKINIHM